MLYDSLRSGVLLGECESIAALSTPATSCYFPVQSDGLDLPEVMDRGILLRDKLLAPQSEAEAYSLKE